MPSPNTFIPEVPCGPVTDEQRAALNEASAGANEAARYLRERLMAAGFSPQRASRLVVLLLGAEAATSAQRLGVTREEFARVYDLVATQFSSRKG